jgi:hypothetical protein
MSGHIDPNRLTVAPSVPPEDAALLYRLRNALLTDPYAGNPIGTSTTAPQSVGTATPINPVVASLAGEPLTRGQMAPTMETAWDMAGMFSDGGLAAGIRGLPLASRNPRMLNLPTEAQPGARLAQSEGIPRYHDPEGRPLTAAFVPGGRGGGGIVEYAVSEAELGPIAEAITGKMPVGASAREMGADVGRYRRDEGISYYRGLTPPQATQVVSHELGHAIDELAGKLPTSSSDLMSELRAVYNAQNNPQSHGPQFLPQHNGYSKVADQNRELWAEAFRAYMTAPDTFKAMAPEAAKLIRDTVYATPRLKDILQFNSLLAPAVVGGTAAAATGQGQGDTP